jgi:cell division septal protein FtsQ
MARNALNYLRDYQTPNHGRRSRRNLKVIRGATVAADEPAGGFKAGYWLPRFLLVATTVSVMIIAGAWAAKQYAASFSVQHVTIQGEFHNRQAHEIETALMPFVRGDFFTVDLQGGREALEELPWVRYAGLRRQWPNRVIVSIQEQVPVARWGQNALLNDAGQVFQHDYVGDTSHLPLLTGPEARETDVLAQYRMLEQQLKDGGLSIAALFLSERNTWKLRTGDGIDIELGGEQIEARLRRLLSVWSGRLRERVDRIASIDLRYSNGFAVGWKTAGSNKEAVGSKRDV